jgi:hypothetical protein
MPAAIDTGETVNLTSEGMIPHLRMDSINQSKDTSEMAVTQIIKQDDQAGMMTSRTADDNLMANINHSRQVEKINTQEIVSAEQSLDSKMNNQ